MSIKLPSAPRSSRHLAGPVVGVLMCALGAATLYLPLVHVEYYDVDLSVSSVTIFAIAGLLWFGCVSIFPLWDLARGGARLTQWLVLAAVIGAAPCWVLVKLTYTAVDLSHLLSNELGRVLSSDLGSLLSATIPPNAMSVSDGPASVLFVVSDVGLAGAGFLAIAARRLRSHSRSVPRFRMGIPGIASPPAPDEPDGDWLETHDYWADDEDQYR